MSRPIRFLLFLAGHFAPLVRRTLSSRDGRLGRTLHPEVSPRIPRRSSRREHASPDRVRGVRLPDGAPRVRFPGTSTPGNSSNHMRPQDNRGSGRRGRGQRRSSRSRTETRAPYAPTSKTSLWQKIVAFFKPSARKSSPSPARAQTTSNYPSKESRPSRKPENVEVTSAKLYVGNLSYDAAESDLFELFKGVGAVRNAEVVTHKHNDKSKGFGFVTMATVDEAKRAVTELHDKDFMGRKLVVSGAKSTEREPNYRG